MSSAKPILPEPILASLEQATGSALGIRSLRPVGRGCINDCQRVDAGADTYFLKRNNARRFPGMFAAEVAGLAALRHPETPPVPACIAHGEAGDEAWLWLSWLEPQTPSPSSWERFGHGLAALHRYTAPEFGPAVGSLSDSNPGATQKPPANNYIGSLPQRNGRHANWPDFFRAERLEPLSALAGETMPTVVRKALADFGDKLDQLVPKEAPALVHGDLWSGNVLPCQPDGIALVDPAVHMGNREADLAMARLFGGFPAAFYAAYQEAFPLQSGWQERIALHQVYPLLVHGILFGGGYWQSLQQNIKSVLTGREP